jgi:8-oxo-dGTP diphosphatase
VDFSRSASAAIFNEGGFVLLIKENYGRHRWNFPGGAIEPGEAPHEAAVRETREETCLEVAVDHLIGAYGLATGHVVYVFRCRVIGGVLTVPNTGEVAELAWHSPDALPSPITNSLYYALSDAVEDCRGVVRHALPLVM